MRPVLALALALALALPGLALATPPHPAWAAYATVNPANAVAISGDGTTSAVAIAGNAAPNVGSTTPSLAQADLAILDIKAGFVINGTTSGACPPSASDPTGQLPGAPPQPPCATYPLGKTHVAISKDGHSVAALGLVATTSNPVGGVIGGTPAQSLQLLYQRANLGWTAKTPTYTNVSRILTGNASDLAISDDGNRVVVITNDATTFTITAFTFDASTLQQKFTYSQSGRANDLATTRDLERIAIATQIPEPGTQLHGALWSYSFSTGQLTGTLYDRSVNGSTLVSAAVASDGKLFAGDQRGRILVADHANEFTPFLMPGASANVTSLALSADGKRLGAAMGASVALLDTTRSAPSLIWNATTAGNVNTLSINRTGGMLVAAVNASDAGVVGYGDADGTPLWIVHGASKSAAVDDEARAVAYVQGTNVQMAKVPRGFSFTLPNGGKASESLPVKPQGSTTIDLVVTNTGAALERITFASPRDTDVTIQASPAVVAVAPDQTVNVTLVATAGKSFTGRHAFNVTATSLTSGLMDNVTLSMLLQTSSVVSLSTSNGTTDVTVAAGVPTQLLLGVKNDGTRDVAVGMRAIQQASAGGDWSVVLDPTTFTLAPDTITTVRATVTAPVSAPNGTSDTVTFFLQGQDVSDQVTVTFRINPTLGLDVEAVGSTKFVEPAKAAYYNVTIKNTGSLPRDVAAFFQTTPTPTGKNWAVEMDTSTFRLEPQATRIIPVKVYAPADAQPNSDSVAVFIVARTVNLPVGENVTQANVTLHAIAIPPTPTTTTPTNPVPGVGPVALVGAIAFVALVLRSRRRSL